MNPSGRTALLLLLVAAPWVLAGCGGDAAADPSATEPVSSVGVAPGSGELADEGHRETDTDLDTWVAPDLGEADGGRAWYAFPLPSGFEVLAPDDGTELLIQSVGEARTVLTVTRLPVEGRLSPELAVAALDGGGREAVGGPVERTVGGVPAIAIDARDTAGEPAMTVRQILLDVGPDRLVITIATDADPAEAELGLVEAVSLDNLRTQVLD